MTIFKTLADRLASPFRRVTSIDQASAESGDHQPDGLLADLGYSKLEQRQVLSATFNLMGSTLVLDQFVAGEDLTFSQENTDIAGSTVDAYVFEIASGSWNGGIFAGIEVESPTRLEVTASLLSGGGVSIDGANLISLSQSGTFAVDSFTATQFSTTDSSFDISIDGSVTVGDISVADSDPLDATNFVVDVEATGSIVVVNNITNTSTNEDASITLAATGANSDLTISDANVVSSAGDITLRAADSVFIGTATDTGMVNAGLAGDVLVESNTDNAVGDSGNSITIADGTSQVLSATGNIQLLAQGTAGGSITLNGVATGGDVTVIAETSIVDGLSASEAAVVTGNLVQFSSGQIGQSDDIDIAATNLGFNSAGLVQIEDVADGITITQASSAGGGSLTANSPLTINANVGLTGSFTFTASDSALPIDDLTIDNAVVSLVAATDQTLTFNAGDDIVFDNGSVNTTGSSNHLVVLNADTEGMADTERGSVTNTNTAAISVSTNQLAITAAAGVGEVANGFRTSVDSITVSNTDSGEVIICETNDLTIVAITNNAPNAEVSVGAGGFIRVVTTINAGEDGIVRLVGNGDIFQDVGSTVVANQFGVRQIGTAVGPTNDVNTNLSLDIEFGSILNDVNIFAANNAMDDGYVVLADADDVTIGAVAERVICDIHTFADTAGVVTTFTDAVGTGSTDVDDGDVLINAGGFLQINESINAGSGTADIRLIANGDILQTSSASLIADELGVRQQETVLSADNDPADNDRLDIILDASGNDVNILAASNAFDSGVISYADADGLTIGDLSEQTLGGNTFGLIQGLSTTFTGTESSGTADTDDGDILIAAEGFLQINQNVSAGGGLADVRMEANGDIEQLITTSIIANELGVIQDSNVLTLDDDIVDNDLFDIRLCGNNQVDFFGATNAFVNGEIQFNNGLDGFTIAEISSQTIGSIFGGADGVRSTNGDILLQSAGFMNIVAPIVAGTANVRLIANGDIEQASTGMITATRLGFRQQSNTPDSDREITANNRFDVILDAENDVDFVAGLNQFESGVITFNDSDDVTVETVAQSGVAPKLFQETSGLTTTFSGGIGTGAGDLDSGDILLTADGFVAIDRGISAGGGNADVRIDGQGDITQNETLGIITANELGVTQSDSALNADDDTDSNSQFDIRLCASNVVDVFAAQNTFDGGQILFDNTQTFAIGNVTTQTIDGSTFGGANGLATLDGDILLNSDGAVNLLADINAMTANLRMIARGDVLQDSLAGITATEFGIRQESNALTAANDLDSNGRYDVVLDGTNDVDQIAGVNQFTNGVFTFNDTDGLTIETVAGASAGGKTFTETSGIATDFAGAAATGSADVDSADIVLNAGGFIQLEQGITAGGGAADVRMTANGDIVQDATDGIIRADELGVIQDDTAFNSDDNLDANSTFDVHLCAANVVNVFGARNDFVAGEIFFDNSVSYSVGTISGQTIDGSVFALTDGITSVDGSVLLNSPSSLNLVADIAAGVGDVRIVANGDILQDSTVGISAGLLGVRQDSNSVAGNDIEPNGRLDIVLDGINDANTIAMFNDFEAGVIVFNDTDGVTVGTVGAASAGSKSFASTSGLMSTFTGAEGLGVGDVDSGDILVTAGGFIDIAQSVTAGNGAADVRLTASGDINQDAAGVITANELGVVQSGMSLILPTDPNDLNSNNLYDIHLCFGNNVDVFAASNQFAAAAIEFNNLQRLVVGTVSSQTIETTSFAGFDGVESNDGDLFLSAAGSFSIQQAVDAGDGDVRLLADGDIQQQATGTITGDVLGIRQENSTFAAAEDLDSNGRFDVLLDDANDVNSITGLNSQNSGTFVFNDVDDLQVGTLAGLNSGNKSFAETTGITTTFAGPGGQGAGDDDRGDVLINAEGSLLINQQISAGNGNADVRLVADGDLHQTATGIIIADELGARLETSTFSVANNIDSNLLFDIILCFDNQISSFAAENQFDGGSVLINSVIDFEVSSVSAQTLGGVSFTATDGIVSTNGVQAIEATNALVISSSINVGTGSLYLVANGDITQTAGTTITANLLAVRQEATAIVGAADTSGNGFLDIILTNSNGVSQVAMSNAFEDGAIAFNSTTDLTVTEVAAVTFCSLMFDQTNGLDSEGDILVQADGFLDIQGEINADDKANDARLIAAGDIQQSGNGTIMANELGVRQQQAAFDADDNINGDTEHDILLNLNNDVNALSMLNFDTNGELEFNDVNDLRIDSVSDQTIGNVTYAQSNGVQSVAGSGDIRLAAGETLNDGDNIPISTGGNGVFTAGEDIEFANQVGDTFLIGGNATFDSDDIEVGRDSTAAGNGNVTMGSVTVDGTAGGTAKITEDDSIVLANTNTTGNMILTSSDDITNADNASITVDRIQLNAADEVRLGNQSLDNLASHNGVLEVGVVANNASITANSNLRLDGDLPVDPTINDPGAAVVLGTDVAGTLFAESQTGFIDQTEGDLDATRLGLVAAQRIHMNSIRSNNVAFAASAGDSNAANPGDHQTILSALEGVNQSEVNALLEQSVSVQHDGVLTITTVINPDVISTDVATASQTGVETNAVEDGSVFLQAETSLLINSDVSASATNALPQITTYVANPVGGANDPSAITFGGGELIVSGVIGTDQNNGTVNNSEVTAFFGTDTDLDGDIDAFLADTTTVIRLEAGSQVADQFVRALYGSPGEEGYRLAYIWDSQRRFDPEFGAAQEIPNLYTANSSGNPGERFDLEIVDQNTLATQNISEAVPTIQNGLIESDFPDLGTFNFETLFVKVDPWTAVALAERIGDPQVFTTVIVRNDQDINLFVGDLGNVDNSLNSTSVVLEGTLETQGITIPSVPFDIEPNQVVVSDPVIPVQQQVLFIQNVDLPEPPRPVDPGVISYQAVDITDPDLVFEVDGELILKNPEKEYDFLDPGDEPEELKKVKKNQVEQIIQRINQDENAEAGLWYKIFIDYEDGSGKEDELLFYYFKTGQGQQDDVGPESDFENSEPDPQNNQDEQSQWMDDKQPEVQIAGSPEVGPELPTTNVEIGETKISDSANAREKLGLTAGTLLLASLAAKKSKTPVIEEEKLEDQKFSRIERMKRKIGSLIRQQKRA